MAAMESKVRSLKADYWKANTIGVFGELAADLATATHSFYRLEERLAQRVRFESVNTTSCPGDEDWRPHLAAEVASARERFSSQFIHLQEHLEMGRAEFFAFILNAKEIEDFAEDAFHLIAEWGAIGSLTSRAAMDAELPPRDWMIVLIGRLEILIERMQAFFKEAGLEPDHFRQ